LFGPENIENFEDSKLNTTLSNFINDNYMFDKITLQIFDAKSKSLLLEKQHLVDAYSSGRFDYEDYVKGIKSKVKQSKEYYQKVYDKKNG
jgi:hypothetical protein